MDVDFAMLLEYLTRKKQPTQVSSEPLEKNKCVHEGIDTDEEYVCQKCGLVLGQIYCPDVHWLEHAIKAREYSDMDRPKCRGQKRSLTSWRKLDGTIRSRSTMCKNC